MATVAHVRRRARAIPLPHLCSQPDRYAAHAVRGRRDCLGVMMMKWIDVVAGVLTAFFVFASSIKLLGWQKTMFETQLAFFQKYGLTRSHIFAVGIVELLGAILLWMPEEA